MLYDTAGATEAFQDDRILVVWSLILHTAMAPQLAVPTGIL